MQNFTSGNFIMGMHYCICVDAQVVVEFVVNVAYLNCTIVSNIFDYFEISG